MSAPDCHRCGSCAQLLRRDFACLRCSGSVAFGWHPDGGHRDAEARCARCNALPPQLRPSAHHAVA